MRIRAGRTWVAVDAAVQQGAVEVADQRADVARAVRLAAPLLGVLHVTQSQAVHLLCSGYTVLRCLSIVNVVRRVSQCSHGFAQVTSHVVGFMAATLPRLSRIRCHGLLLHPCSKAVQARKTHQHKHAITAADQGQHGSSPSESPCSPLWACPTWRSCPH